MRSTLRFEFGGKTMLADAAGGLYWPEEQVLVVSDLHLEKGSGVAAHYRRHLPPYDTRSTLASLSHLMAHYRPRQVICLGDSFHDGNAADRMEEEDCEKLRKLTRQCDWIWIAGNHDPAPPACFGGRAEPSLSFGPLVLLHKAENSAPYELSGHYHPKASIVVHENRVSGRCFIIDRQHLILPAFGAFTGGLDVRDPAFAPLLSTDFTVGLIGRQRIVHLPAHRLSGNFF